MDEILVQLAGSSLTGISFRTECMEAIAELPGCDWCGIYRLELDHLILDAYVGAPTDHERIPVGQGVCGTAVKTGENQIVDDVSVLDNYLSCSISTKSEIVVLIRSKQDGKTILGQIDIDSHQAARFGETDETFLTRLAEMIAARW